MALAGFWTAVKVIKASDKNRTRYNDRQKTYSLTNPQSCQFNAFCIQVRICPFDFTITTVMLLKQQILALLLDLTGFQLFWFLHSPWCWEKTQARRIGCKLLIPACACLIPTGYIGPSRNYSVPMATVPVIGNCPLTFWKYLCCLLLDLGKSFASMCLLAGCSVDVKESFCHFEFGSCYLHLMVQGS